VNASDENQKSVPPPAGAGEYVREVPDHPVVRDSEDNPVVRQRGLETALLPVRRWLWTATGIGIVNVLGPRIAEHAAPSTPSEPATLIQLILQYL